jgi:hypothetical protein
LRPLTSYAGMDVSHARSSQPLTLVFHKTFDV